MIFKMTLSDFLKRVKNCPTDKMMVLVDENGGWTNINMQIDENRIAISADKQPLFRDDC